MFTTNSGRFISYYGREHTLDIQRQDGNNPTISTIDQLFNVLLNVWCKETAYPSCQKDYDYDNDPTYGQCAITASLVYDLFDGTIYKLKVDGGGTVAGYASEGDAVRQRNVAAAGRGLYIPLLPFPSSRILLLKNPAFVL